MRLGTPIDPPVEQPTVSEIHSNMDEAIKRAMAPPLRIKTSSPTVNPMSKRYQRINHTEQEAYNHTMLESGWLSMANRHETGAVLIPNPESTAPRRFLTWSTDVRNLWILIDSGTPTAYFATWTLDSLQPTGNPFDPNRLQPLQQTVDHWLAECNQRRPIDVDHRQNVRSWSGTDCSGWDLWVEYTPTEERALSIHAVQR